MIKIGMIIGERYEILEKIGTGGMSDVYKAKDHKLNRAVAIKILKQEFSENESFVSKFRVEAQAAAGLMHANIVNVYDVGEERGIYYIVMELVEGITLKKYIEKKARLSVKEAISIAIQVSLGIEAAHNNRIIHRDIKPQNIMISKEGRVKVTDFGIAKAATSNTITSNVMGSVHYTSPEQARGGYSDAKSDIYSLGITLFEMLTGRVPFNGETTVSIAIKHIQETMPSPRDFVPEIPISVEMIVLKCTQKRPDARYQSMAELTEDLKRSLVTPDENFVKMNGANANDETRMLNERDSVRVKQAGKTTQANSEPIRLSESAARERRQAREKNNAPKSNPVQTKPQNASGARPAAGRKQVNEDDYSSSSERAMTVVMVVIAVVIGCVVFYVLGRMIGIFPLSGGQSNPNPPAATASPTPTAGGQMLGDAKVEVPDVSTEGTSQAEATKTLEQRGFKVRIEKTISTKVLKGDVISQTPRAGDMVDFGSEVTLLISEGADTSTVIVPQLFGYTQEDARDALLAVGLDLGDVKEDFSDIYPAGQVCVQEYVPGGNVVSGTKVDITISIGPRPRSYTCAIVVEAPMDPEYTGGEATVMLIGSDNKIYHEASVSVFPIAVNVSGIPVPSGMVKINYTVTRSVSTTDEFGNTVVGTQQETRSEQMPVPFTEE